MEGVKVMGGSCCLRYELRPFFNASAANDPVPAPSPSTPTPAPPPKSADSAGSKKDDNTTTMIVVGIAVGLGLSAAAISAVVCINRMKMRRKLDAGKLANIGQSVSSFDLETLKVVTDNFSESNKLGEGGLGTVYKGVLPDDRRLIAVKTAEGLGAGPGGAEKRGGLGSEGSTPQSGEAAGLLPSILREAAGV